MHPTIAQAKGEQHMTLVTAVDDDDMLWAWAKELRTQRKVELAMEDSFRTHIWRDEGADLVCDGEEDADEW